MKLKKRLMMPFMIIIFVPMILGLFGMWAVGKYRIRFMEFPHGDWILYTLLGLLTILMLTALLLSWWLYHWVLDPIKKLQQATKSIAEGNLDFEMKVDIHNEIGDLCQNYEQMRKKLKEASESRVQQDKENKILISNICHDLKTPITAIKGYVEGIMDGVAATPEKQEKYIRTIYNKTNEMDTLINELTIYSRLDTNRVPYNFQKLNVADYFTDCLEEVSVDLEAENVELGYFNYADNQTLIIADPEQLKRVIHNIIGNAVKYMDKERAIINIRIKDVGDFVQIEIEDNGKGIPGKDLPYIFDRFFRGDASRNMTKGTGIGLSIVKKILDDHGGKIWATSKEKVGTTMYFVLRKYQEVPNE